MTINDVGIADAGNLMLIWMLVYLNLENAENDADSCIIILSFCYSDEVKFTTLQHFEIILFAIFIQTFIKKRYYGAIYFFSNNRWYIIEN